jgi:hypothetical protein
MVLNVYDLTFLLRGMAFIHITIFVAPQMNLAKLPFIFLLAIQ